ncbi:MAG: ABC transporter permease subunit [Pseudomonadota bacterium]
MISRTFPFAASLAAFIVVWIIAATMTADPSILPNPLEVLGIMWLEATEGPLFEHLFATLARVAAAFTIAMVVGVAVGVVLGKSEEANRWFGPWVTIFLNIPALVVIVLCYLWVGLSEAAAILAVAVNKTAMVAVTIREGAAGLNPRLAEMGQIYRMSVWDRYRHIALPQLWPYIYASMRNGIAIIWKIVLVAEFLGRSNGVGFQIHLYFQLFETGYVLAYAFAFVAIMLAIEIGIFSVAERRTNAWARSTA